MSLKHNFFFFFCRGLLQQRCIFLCRYKMENQPPMNFKYSATWNSSLLEERECFHLHFGVWNWNSESWPCLRGNQWRKKNLPFLMFFVQKVIFFLGRKNYMCWYIMYIVTDTACTASLVSNGRLLGQLLLLFLCLLENIATFSIRSINNSIQNRIVKAQREPFEKTDAIIWESKDVKLLVFV